MFDFLHQWFSGNRIELDGLSEQEVETALSAAIESSDTRIRLASGYQKKLRPVVVDALLHARSLIRQIPGPLEINRQAFAANPQVHSLFGAVEQLGEVFGASQEVQAFKKQAWKSEQQHLYGLLLMTLNEKTRPGFVLNGEMVQSDVMQKIAYFSDHQVVKVCGSLDEVRTQLRARALATMIAEFSERVLRHKRRLTDLQRDKSRLCREVKALGEQSEAAVQLAELDAELQLLKGQLLSVDDYLDLLIDVLSNPDQHCGLEHRDLHLNRSGVKLADVGSEDGHEIPYAEISVSGLQRVGILVKFPLDEVPDPVQIRCGVRMGMGFS